MLKSERNSKYMERRVRRAAARVFGRGKTRPVYEHGQWWLKWYDKTEDVERIFAVVDAEPGIADTGLSFEPC